MEKRLVIFTQTNARVLINPPHSDLLEYSNWPNTIVDPDLSLVDGVPPHFWKLKDGLIVPMSPGEREARLNQIEKIGADNKLVLQKPKFPRPQYIKPVYIDWIAYGAILGALYYLITK